jgi:Aerotolerance regulator N-terminal/von Willebrand factor type A domain
VTATPAAIEFLAPAFLAGALAAVIPLIIHMLHRQRAREKRFSTLRFLKLSVEKTARKRRLRDLWLLLFRMAVVALLAAGLSRPLLRGSGAFSSNRAAAVVIVLDNSASMALADGGAVRFERARNLALSIVGRLREGDEIALVLTGGRSLQQDATYRRVENVQRLIEESAVCLAGADIPAAIRKARKLLESSQAPNKELYVITDLQESGWRSQRAGDRDFADDNSEAPLVLVDVHKTRPVNVAIEDVRVHAAVPAVGVPHRVVATVRNGATNAQTVQVELTVDGLPAEQSQPERLGPGERRKFEFNFVPEQGGIKKGRVSLLGSDASRLDDERFFVVDTQSAVPVALVDDRREGQDPHRSGGYYLERALRPVAGSASPIQLTVLKSQLLTQEPLGTFAAVLCVDLPTADQPTLEALSRYVSSGGTLFWICGPNSDPALMKNSELFPGTFSFPDDAQAGWHWAFLDEQHADLRPLAHPQSLYLSVTVDRYLRLALPPESPARVLARLNNGDPALVSHTIGRGTVYTLTSGANARWTTLPLRPIFLPLISRLVLRSAERERGPLEVPAGNAATFRFANEPKPVTIELDIPGQTEPTRLVTTANNGQEEFRFDDTFAAGVYRLRMTDARNPRQFAFAVNLDPAETDPHVIDREQLESLLGTTFLTATDEASLADTIQRLREGTPLMDWFLIVVLIAGVAEILIANVTGRQEPLAEQQRAPDIRDVLRRAQTTHQLESFGRPFKTAK